MAPKVEWFGTYRVEFDSHRCTVREDNPARTMAGFALSVLALGVGIRFLLFRPIGRLNEEFSNLDGYAMVGLLVFGGLGLALTPFSRKVEKRGIVIDRHAHTVGTFGKCTPWQSSSAKVEIVTRTGDGTVYEVVLRTGQSTTLYSTIDRGEAQRFAELVKSFLSGTP